MTTANNFNLAKNDLKTIPAATSLFDTINNSNHTKRVTINFSNAQDLLAVAPMSRMSSVSDGSSGSSSAPMITIHILPEVAQALLGSTSVDRVKLAELLQQASAANASSITPTLHHMTSDSMTTSTATNSIS